MAKNKKPHDIGETAWMTPPFFPSEMFKIIVTGEEIIKKIISNKDQIRDNICHF